MNGYLLVLVAMAVVPAVVLGGCAEKRMCCKGKDNACKAKGQRMNGKSSKTCFCDETCLFLGDCCTDFKQVCKEQDCVLGKFEGWGKCSESCGWGVKTRSRPVIQEPRNGGKVCEKFEEKIYCYGDKCKVPRHSNGHMEVRETGKIIPAEFGAWRASKLYDPYKDIRRNLFNHYNAKDLIKRPAYCAKFEVTEAKSSCRLATENPWGAQLRKGNTVCVECQPFAMQRKIGVRCKGHGVFMRETRWNAVTVGGCHGKWVMKTRHEECTCATESSTSFVLI